MNKPKELDDGGGNVPITHDDNYAPYTPMWRDPWKYPQTIEERYKKYFDDDD